MTVLSVREFSNIVAIDTLVLHLAKNRMPGLVFPTKTPFTGERKKFVGAYVFEPVPGVHKNVINLDYKSLYPSIIRTFNMGPETFRPDGSGDITGWKGTFLSEPESVHSEMLGIVNREREAAKDKRRQEEPDSDEWHVWNSIQYAWKVLKNASYGALGSPFTRYYNPDIAENITQIGRELLQYAAKKSDEIGFSLLYGDTDSVLLRTPEGLTLDMLPTAADMLTKFLVENIQNYCREKYGVGDIEIEIEVDKIYGSILFSEREEDGKVKGVKKRYAGLVVWEDNKPADYMLIKGFETVRNDWCLSAREFQKKLLRMLLEEVPMAEILVYCGEVREGLFSGELDKEIAQSKGLNKDIGSYKVNAPHVRVAKMLIAKGEVVRKGDHIQYLKYGKLPEQIMPYRDGMDLRKALSELSVSPEKAYDYVWEKQFSRMMDRLNVTFDEQQALNI